MTDRQQGFAAVEWLLGLGLILMPVIVIVGSIAPWYQRANMANLMAQEAARVMVLADDWATGEAEARVLAQEIAANHGFGSDDWCGSPAPGCVSISFEAAVPGVIQRATEVTVSIEVPIPGVVVPFVGEVAPFQWAGVHTERVDDYRSIVRNDG